MPPTEEEPRDPSPGPRDGPSSPAPPHHPECLAILGLLPPVTAEDVKQAYLAKAKTVHPDHGGDQERFVRLQKAYEEAQEYVRFKAGKLEWLASKIDAYSQQQDVVVETIERGGEVEMEEAEWLRRSFGEDFGHVADKLVSVRLRGPAADDVFAVLLGFRAESLQDLSVLDLAGGSLTDEGLLQLKGLRKLRSLDLRGTRVGKLAAEAPRWFERLEFLGLPPGAAGLLTRLGMPRRVKVAIGAAPD